MVFLNGSSGTNTIVEWRILHAFHNSLATGIDFLGVVAAKGGRNGGSVVHPAFQFELSHNLVVSVRFCSALCDLVTPYIWFVEIVHKVDGELDQEIPLRLGVVRIVEPIAKVCLVSKPQHGVSTVLDPIGLLPLLHDNGAKGNS